MKCWGDVKMKSVMNNTGYFLKEVRTIIRLDLMSNIFSLLSNTLIFFILAMVMSGWWISNEVVQAIQGEAEISVYFEDHIGSSGASTLVEKIKTVNGVGQARIVDEGEAYERMADILGKDAQVLAFFDDNPFSSFIEVKIHLEEIDSVLDQLSSMTGVNYVRDNREVLERLRSIAGILRLLGYVVVGAVGISTLVIISHIIRQGIYSNREQINTLRLLGAPEMFIAFPFLLEGIFLTLGGGLLASTLAAFAIKYAYVHMAGPLPFFPLPPLDALITSIVMLITVLSGCMGIVGSVLGFTSAKSK